MAEDNYVYQVIAAFLSRSLLSFRSTPSFNHHPSSFSVLPPDTVQPGHPISHQDVHPLPASFLERRGLAGLSFPRELLESPVPPCTGLLAVSCPPGQDYPFRPLGKRNSLGAGTYLLAENSRQAGSHMLAKRSQQAGPHVLAKRSRRAGGYLLAEISQAGTNRPTAISSLAGTNLLAEALSKRCLPAC
ncbi:hypothetical protein PCANC_21723 [Puccinia coronata f. sp. avenae]|uniref:Uncharacterized protein n=1 Tax=Puccinia coronata f. sp. avenae TaxID=200324 RepID=A0A2N5S4L4_9BASI|nr:hypothetical protein PCANC_21723 [Puccinia coronata f. sp. avenae]